MVRFLFLALTILGTASCSTEKEEYTVTLYRNSILDKNMRVHWATFNADESDPTYNLQNCDMAARILNANYLAANEIETSDYGFWREPGKYKAMGSPKIIFDAEFPVY